MDLAALLLVQSVFVFSVTGVFMDINLYAC